MKAMSFLLDPSAFSQGLSSFLFFVVIVHCSLLNQQLRLFLSPGIRLSNFVFSDLILLKCCKMREGRIFASCDIEGEEGFGFLIEDPYDFL